VVSRECVSWEESVEACRRHCSIQAGFNGLGEAQHRLKKEFVTSCSAMLMELGV